MHLGLSRVPWDHHAGPMGCHRVAWDLTFGLDMVNPNPQIWSEELGHKEGNWTPRLFAPLNHMHVYAGKKIPETSQKVLGGSARGRA